VEKLQQLASLTAIRKLVEKHFPHEDFYYIDCRLKEQIELDDYEEIDYEEGRGYILKTTPICKVCRSTAYLHLTEVQTLRGSFHICNSCKKDIASAKPEPATV